MRHNNQLDNDTDTVRNGVAQQGDNHIGESRNNRHGKTHHDSRFQLSRYSQCRTDTQHLYGNRVVQCPAGLRMTSLFFLKINCPIFYLSPPYYLVKKLNNYSDKLSAWHLHLQK